MGKRRLDSNSPGWEEFTTKLSNALDRQPCKCNFEQTVNILSGRSEFSIPDTISWLEENHAYCDCEILLNID